MGRIFSGRPAKDTERAEESLIERSLVNPSFRNNAGSSAPVTVTAQLQCGPAADDFSEQKSH